MATTYTDDQIVSAAQQMKAAGASDAELETAISTMKQAQVNVPPPVDWQNYAKQVALQTAKTGGTMATSLAGAATGAEIGSPGGPIGMGLGTLLGGAYGYYAGKKAMGDNPTLGESVQGGALTAIAPEISPASSMLIRGLKTGATAAGTYAVSDAARQGIDNGKIDVGSTIKNAAQAAIIPSVLGAATATPAPAVSDAMAGKIAAAQAGKRIKLVTAPSAAGNENPLVRTLETFANPTDLDRLASKKNATGGMNVFRNFIGIPSGNDPITLAAIKSRIGDIYNTTYAPVMKAGTGLYDTQFQTDMDNAVSQFSGKSPSYPLQQDNGVEAAANVLRYKPDPKTGQLVPNQTYDTAAALGQIQNLRDGASKAFDAENDQLGHGLTALSKAVESQVERDLTSRGSAGQDMLQQYRQGRVQTAQANFVKDSLTWSDRGIGTINPAKVGAVYQRQQGQGLSGGLEAIGAMAKNQPASMQNPATMTEPGLGMMDSLIGGGIAMGSGLPSLIHGDWQKALAVGGGASVVGGIAMPAMRGMVRSGLLSPWGQAALARPTGASGFLPTPLAIKSIQAALMAKASSDNNAPPGLSQYIAAQQPAGASQ